jgi:hypothetical protein
MLLPNSWRTSVGWRTCRSTTLKKKLLKKIKPNVKHQMKTPHPTVEMPLASSNSSKLKDSVNELKRNWSKNKKTDLKENWLSCLWESTRSPIKSSMKTPWQAIWVRSSSLEFWVMMKLSKEVSGPIVINAGCAADGTSLKSDTILLKTN